MASVFNEVITNDMAANLAPFLAPALLIAVSSCNHERVRVGLREQDSPKCTDCCRSMCLLLPCSYLRELAQRVYLHLLLFLCFVVVLLAVLCLDGGADS